MINIGLLITKSPQIQKYCRMSSIVASNGPVFDAITSVIREKLQPAHFEVLNESFMHNVPKGSETHFKVLIVSTNFEGLPLIKRHRLVNNILKEKLGELFPHALSIDAKTPEQWQPSNIIEPSPNCKGGFGK